VDCKPAASAEEEAVKCKISDQTPTYMASEPPGGGAQESGFDKLSMGTAYMLFAS